jgi:hypothetical protein
MRLPKSPFSARKFPTAANLERGPDPLGRRQNLAIDI